MTGISRRRLLATGAAGAALDAIPFKTWFTEQAWAGPPRVRYNAYSTEGKAMLVKYRDAVATMMGRADKLPTSWVFQWYTHWVKQPPGKASELSRIYPQPSDPYRALANEMWGTCQAHGPGEREDFFMPWHRMYVCFLEQIVREASGDPNFTLPYWNYSNPAQRAMPPEFRVSSSKLYRVNRNAGVNTGSQIPGSLVELTALNEPIYSASGADQGFCAAVDFGIHGNVHVWVGNGQGMGSVPWAANDPIFWMHHCNIDRLWASWNKHGCQNPKDQQWRNKEFVFALPNNTKVVATVKDFEDIEQLGYTYQEFEPVNAVCKVLTANVNPRILASLTESTRVAPLTSRLKLAAPKQLNALALQDSVKALPAEQSVYLVLRDVQADSAPGVIYEIYLDLAAGTKPSTDLPNFIGALNFFGATSMGSMPGMSDMAEAMTRTFSYEVTDKVKALQASGRLTGEPSITLVPQGAPSKTANPVIGQIELVAQ